jgi:hypothetical protein
MVLRNAVIARYRNTTTERKIQNGKAEKVQVFVVHDLLNSKDDHDEDFVPNGNSGLEKFPMTG